MLSAEDRRRLQDLGFKDDVIEKTDEVMTLWDVDCLFVKCSYCNKYCYNPNLPKGKHLRKKLPAALFWRYELCSVAEADGEPTCLPCDDFNFEYM